jgi:hypothetical protein
MTTHAGALVVTSCDKDLELPLGKEILEETHKGLPTD